MSKHIETMTARENSRAQLLELRRVGVQKRREIQALITELRELDRRELDERARFVQLTADVAKLVNADLVGIMGKDIAEGAPGFKHDGGGERACLPTTDAPADPNVAASA